MVLKENKIKLPLIFDIHHSALDDGPGIRTTIFLKGCPLSCLWCQNPESLKSTAQIAYYQERCIQCGDCKTICPENAVNPFNHKVINREKCNACGWCADECPTTALRVVGKYYTVGELVDVILKDEIFYETSNGGITFSGGEPTLYMDYVSDVMKELKRKDVHIAIQTSGMFKLSEFKSKVLPYLDLIFYDIKIFDSKMHKKYTGKFNEQILQNFIELTKESNTIIVPRVPLIPGITDTTHNLDQIDDFIKSVGIDTYELLPYNSSGISKRTRLGMEIPPVVL